MAEAPPPGGRTTLAIDYSDDELDAIADLYRRPDLGSGRLRRPPQDPVEQRVVRAALTAATRGLVARRALVLDGTPAFPRVRFLEPHATVLGAFVGADATASVKVETPGHAETRALFAHRDVVVDQRAAGATAIKRLVAHPRPAGLELLCAGLPLSEEPAPAGAGSFELPLGTLGAAADAVAAGEEPPAGVPGLLLDVLHARTGSATVVVRRRGTGGVVLADRLSWLAAGVLGNWRIEPVGTQPSTVARLVPITARTILERLRSAWAGA